MSSANLVENIVEEVVEGVIEGALETALSSAVGPAMFGYKVLRLAAKTLPSEPDTSVVRRRVRAAAVPLAIDAVISNPIIRI